MSRYATEPDPKAVALSGRLFERLLAAYPQHHRRKYGPAMAQLFRDQCRDAWRAAGGWGLTCLWLRVLPDLVKSSVLEHISTLKERIAMLDRIGSLLRPRSAPLFVFLAGFIAVFFLVVVTTTIITFILPETFASTARILVRQEESEAARKPESPSSALGSYDPYFIQTQFELIQSQATLGKVIENLDLNRLWGKKFAGGGVLRTSESLALLKRRLEFRPMRNTSLIEIRTFSDDPAEAAALANAIAKAYRDWSLPHKISVEFVDTALPGLRPVRPNKALNIALGVIIGGFLAVVAGAGLAGIAALIRGKSRTSAPPGTGAAPPPAVPRSAAGSATVGDPTGKQAAANAC